MNHIYRVVFNASLGVWQAVSEIGKGAGKGKSHARRHRAYLATLAGSVFLVSCHVYSASLPQNGVVTSGSGSITQPNTNTLNITQNTNKMVIDWNSFSVGNGNTVNFIQPSNSAIALNRVTGTDVSNIQGSINANGQVFLINPNGILFSTTAQVNVGALVASTRNISNDDFNNSNFKFEGSNGNAIINQGTIKTADGGYVVMVAAKIENTGNITANQGTVALAAGDRVLVDMGGVVKVEVQSSAIDALITNGGAIKAEGGHILLTAKAAGDLAASVLNNTGMLDASSLSSVGGKIMLVADDITNSGSLHATGVNAGGEVIVGNATNASTTIKSTSDIKADFVETSGKKLKVEQGVTVKAKQWLLDPTDITITQQGAEGITGSNIAGQTVQDILNAGTGVTLSATNDITVNYAMNWNQSTLTLTAGNNININAVLTAFGTAGLTMNTSTVSGKGVKVGIDANGAFTGRVEMTGSGGLTINGDTYTAVTSASDLAGMNLSGKYYLQNNITDTDMATINSGNWTPIGTITTADAPFTGKFNGLGHTISGLSISLSDLGSGNSDTGLFGATRGALISNIGILNPSITITGASVYTGALVGFAQDTNIYNSYVKSSDTTKKISSQGGYVGGLVGGFGSGIGSLTGAEETNVISGSYTNIIVEGRDSSGGLVGSVYRYNGAYKNAIVDSYASGIVTTTDSMAGGLIGLVDGGNDGHIDLNHVYATGNVTAGIDSNSFSNAGGLIGKAKLGITSSIQNAYATGDVTATGSNVGGLIGLLNQGNVSFNYTTLSNIYATGNVTSTGYNVAGLIGNVDAWQEGFVRIDHAHYTNSSTGVSGDSCIGGLIGNANGYSGGGNRSNIGIEKSYVTVTSTATIASASGSDGDIGGLVGYANSGMFIKQSYFEGTIDAPSGLAGGLVGEMPSKAWIADSYAKATFINLSATPSDVGGILGKINYDGDQEDPFINRSYAISNFRETGSSSTAVTAGVGGLVGTASNFPANTDISISSSFFSHDAAAIDAVASDASLYITAAKTDIELKDIRTFRNAGWDIIASEATNPYPSITMNDTPSWEMPYRELVYNNFLATGSTATLSSGAGGAINFANNGTLTLIPTASSGYLVSDFKVKLQENAGDLNVDQAVSWSDFKLVLDTTGNININATMTATNTASLTMNTGAGKVIKASFNDDGTFKGKVDVAGTGELKINGDVYTRINNVTELQAINNNIQTISGDDYVTGNYYLGANIDASATSGWNSGAGFVPLGRYHYAPTTSNWYANTYFSGNFQGFGHTITGLTINTDLTSAGEYGATGLFGQVGGTTDVTISNIGLTGATIQGKQYTGGLIGKVQSDHNVTITNSYIAGTITGTTGAAGGLIGRLRTGSVTNSYADVALTAEHDAGGLVGRMDNETTISSSYTKGTVQGGRSVGGFIGELSSWDNNPSNRSTINNSYSTATVTGATGATAVGGFAGKVENYVKIENSYSTGAVSGVGDLGGFAGIVMSNSLTDAPNNGSNDYIPTLTNNFWDKETSCKTVAFNGSHYDDSWAESTPTPDNGLTGTVEGKTTAEMKTLTTFSGTTPAWDISGVDGSYPTLTMGGANIWTMVASGGGGGGGSSGGGSSGGGSSGGDSSGGDSSGGDSSGGGSVMPPTKIMPEVQFSSSVVTRKVGDTVFTQSPTVTTGAGNITYRSSDPSVAVVNPTTGAVTIMGAGKATITATVAANENYKSTTSSYMVNVDKGMPTLGFANSNLSRTIGDSVFTQSPTVTTGAGDITYRSSDPSVAVVNSTTGAVTIIGAGKATITATVAANENYASTTSSYMVSVEKGIPTINFADLNVTKTVGDHVFTQLPTVTTGAGEITYRSSDPSVAVVNSTTGAVTIIGAGKATITANVAESDRFLSDSFSYVVAVEANKKMDVAVTNAVKQPSIEIQKTIVSSKPQLSTQPITMQESLGSVGHSTGYAPVTIGGMSVVAVEESSINEKEGSKSDDDRKKDHLNNESVALAPTMSNQLKIETAIKAEAETRGLGLQKVFVIDGGIRTPQLAHQ